MNIKLILIIFLIQFIYIELKEDYNNSDLSKTNETEGQNELLELNDSNFDSTIQNGNNNRWLILFYLQTCYHCTRALDILNTTLELQEYENINNIKFASIEVSKNPKSSVRFNITKIPYIILVENKTMFELDSYVSEQKIFDFIQTNFTDVANDLKPFPQYSFIKYCYVMFANSMYFALDKCNSFLESKNVKFRFNLITLILSYVVVYSLFCFIILYPLKKCLKRNNKNKAKNNKKDEKNNLNKDNNKNELNKNTNETNGNDGDDNINNEEKKKIREENKEKEEKMKKNKESEKNKDKNTIKQKKKKIE